MRAHFLSLGAAALLIGACGPDKNYGDPIEDPNATAHATAAVTNVGMLRADTTNDTALNALNAYSGNANLLAGIKLQHEQGDPQAASAPLAVDEACVVVSESGIVYSDCDFAGNTVNGSVQRTGDQVDVDLSFARADQDTTTDIDITAALTINDVELSGFLDIDMLMTTEGGAFRTIFDSDFDVTLGPDLCPVGGDLEIYAKVSAGGRSQDVWVLAEYGPECGAVTVR